MDFMGSASFFGIALTKISDKKHLKEGCFDLWSWEGSFLGYLAPCIEQTITEVGVCAEKSCSHHR